MAAPTVLYESDMCNAYKPDEKNRDDRNETFKVIACV